jgi:hypothetical protein
VQADSRHAGGMSDILFHYHRVNPTTWFYFASLLSIALFFKFNRLWSVRNLDLLGLILLAPGILAVEYGGYKANVADQQLGFVWIFVVSGWFLARMLCDSMMVRRPMLEPNLTTGGLTFLGVSLLVFLLANVITTRPQRDDLAGAAARGAATGLRQGARTRSTPSTRVARAAAPTPRIRGRRDRRRGAPRCSGPPTGD